MDEDDSERRSCWYPHLDGSPSRTAYVSVQKVLDDLATPTDEGHRTRKSISTSSTVAKGKFCETLRKVDAGEKSKVGNQEARLGDLVPSIFLLYKRIFATRRKPLARY